MKMCPMFSTPTIQEEETIKLGNLSPLFVEQEDPRKDEREEYEEEETDPLVKLGNLSPLFIGE